MKLVVRDNYQNAKGVISDPLEYKLSLIERAKGVLGGLNAQNVNRVRAYAELYTLLEYLRDIDNIGSMSIVHEKLKIDNAEGTFITRKYINIEGRAIIIFPIDTTTK